MIQKVKQSRSKVDRARQYLTTGGVARDDSDDELGYDDHPWEWIFSQNGNTVGGDPEIIGARMGRFECRVGDSVLLKAEGTHEAWIGLICDFEFDDEAEEKMANFMWFSTEREVRNKQKKRQDALMVRMHLGLMQFWLKHHVERSLHHPVLGSESINSYKWKGFHHVSDRFQCSIPFGQSAPADQRVWQSICLS